MNHLTLKCTRYTIVENEDVRFYIKDVDSNVQPPAIKGILFDSVTIIDKDAKQTKFYVVTMKEVEPSLMDGDWKVTPVLANFSHKEDIA